MLTAENEPDQPIDLRCSADFYWQLYEAMSLASVTEIIKTEEKSAPDNQPNGYRAWRTLCAYMETRDGKHKMILSLEKICWISSTQEKEVPKL